MPRERSVCMYSFRLIETYHPCQLVSYSLISNPERCWTIEKKRANESLPCLIFLREEICVKLHIDLQQCHASSPLNRTIYRTDDNETFIWLSHSSTKSRHTNGRRRQARCWDVPVILFVWSDRQTDGHWIEEGRNCSSMDNGHVFPLSLSLSLLRWMSKEKNRTVDWGRAACIQHNDFLYDIDRCLVPAMPLETKRKKMSVFTLPLMSICIFPFSSQISLRSSFHPSLLVISSAFQIERIHWGKGNQSKYDCWFFRLSSVEWVFPQISFRFLLLIINRMVVVCAVTSMYAFDRAHKHIYSCSHKTLAEEER